MSQQFRGIYLLLAAGLPWLAGPLRAEAVTPSVTKPMSPRAFLAVTFPVPIVEGLEAIQAKLRASDPSDPLDPSVPSVRWSAPESFHLTLRFLDRLDPSQIDRLVPALRSLSAKTPPFRVTLGGVGFFPFRGGTDPRVLWAGLATPSPALESLASEIERVVQGQGLLPADFPFRAHITLGRVRRPSRSRNDAGPRPPKSGRSLQERLHDLAEHPVGSLEVSSFVLFQVEEGPGEGRYRQVAVFPLGPDS